MSFGEHLKHLRKNQRLTQLNLAEEAGISKSYLSFLESDARHPSREVALKLSEILCENAEQKSHFLSLAGFSKNASPPPSSEPPHNFATYLRYVLSLIKQGQLGLAQSRIENGFSRYSKPAQMQTLLAHLELAKGNFEHAIIAQKAAIEQYNLEPQEQSKGLSLGDFWANLGVMQFLLADHYRYGESSKKGCLASYQNAASSFQEALKHDPHSAYFQDELGRTYLNMIDLEPEKKSHLHQAIIAFESVLANPDKGGVNQEHLYETTAFLGHAYTKNKQFDQAKTLLNVLISFFPERPLAHYLMATYCSLYDEERGQKAHMEQGLYCLKKSFEGDEMYRLQALEDKDKDLKYLFQHHPELGDLL